MVESALQIVEDDEHHEQFRRLVLELDGGSCSYYAHEVADKGFPTWQDAW